ncbi:amidohydrolase family protein [Paenarthrobacter nicotinovorans]|uniref:amidohydrolase family protein n=1 Tax=Paenarthrobacter nicotinovorans TaxID=29320 RepID=UPI0011A58EEE|nr:amidohydrolase family protein [Paenarthrobacter nicotinovorans]
MMIDIHAHVTADFDSYRQRAEEAGVTRPVLLSTSVHPENAATLAEVRAEFDSLAQLLDGADTPDALYKRSQQEVLGALAVWPEAVTMRKIPLEWDYTRILAAAGDAVADPRTVGFGEVTPAGGQGALIEAVVRASAETAAGRPLPVLTHGIAPNNADDLRAYAAVATRYPQVPVIIGAFGGLNSMLAVDLAIQHTNVYLDLSSALQLFVVRAALKELPDRCLFGSNTPYGDVLAARDTIEAATKDRAVRSRALKQNAQELFGLAN